MIMIRIQMNTKEEQTEADLLAPYETVCDKKKKDKKLY